MLGNGAAMNPVEIDEAVSNLVLEPFDRAQFAYRFLAQLMRLFRLAA
ncbi:MAG: hypothetical protein RJA87_1665 [Pseudomonadota bacterium]|jgi:hypothetical protein